jgi:hypothetical protein
MLNAVEFYTGEKVPTVASKADIGYTLKTYGSREGTMDI